MFSVRKSAILLSLLLSSSIAEAQSSGGFGRGQTLTADQLNAAFAAKVDFGVANTWAALQTFNGDVLISSSDTKQLQIDNPGGQYSALNFLNSGAQKTQMYWDNINSIYNFNVITGGHYQWLINNSVSMVLAGNNQLSLGANGGAGGSLNLNGATSGSATLGVTATGGTLTIGGVSAISTTCTVTAGNTLVFTNGILTTKGANCT